MQIYNKNIRKGLIRDTTSLVVAIIGILLLLFAVYQLYKVFVEQDSEVAKRTINIIEAKINLLEEGQTGKFPIKGPWNKNRKWYLVGWGKENTERPDKCYFDSCICICDGYLKESCQGRNGFCRKVDVKNINVEKTLIFNSGPGPNVGGGGNVPARPEQREEVSAIEFPANLIELQIKKNKDSLEIGYKK
ncbi:hypothetical protein HYW75_04480 [Candidatus Pacearchaeota archaeon]|nr:hypothetical protein [Candidatus Pacearchaeota archaeon]